jgi:tRNA threonylcarbamoyladenosine biosynthesis protein TsaE
MNANMRKTLELPSLSATFELGRALGRLLFPGAVVGLEGTLGAGKTHLVRAIAEGLEVADYRVVTSPTFVLLQEYHGRLAMYHYDSYRLNDPQAFVDLGFFEQLEAGGVCLIEWANKVASLLPADRLTVRLEVTGVESRRVQLEAGGPAHAVLLNLKDLGKS